MTAPHSLYSQDDGDRLLADMREWAVHDVRPLAREADTTHAPPRDAAEVLAKCPIDTSPLAMVAQPGEPRREGGMNSHALALRLMEEVVYGDIWPLNLQPGAGLAHKVIPLLGTAAQVDRWVGGLERGDFSASAFALTEAHFGSDAAQVATTAVLDGEDWVLNGTKIFCSGGAHADFIIVFASIDRSRGREAIRAFIVECDTPGFAVVKPNERKLGLRSQDTATVAFDDVRIPLDHCLGIGDAGDVAGPQPGLWAALETLTFSRPFMAAAAVGIGQASIDYASAWLSERREEVPAEAWCHGQRVIENVAAHLEQARFHIRRVGWLRDQGQTARIEGSMAKAFAPPIAEMACLRAMQLMGPEGASKQHLVEKWYRDVKIFDIFEGSGQIQRVTIARQLLGSGSGSR
jgi:alkylation response protein AidB-like acyl-CoA dehydrogenase